MQWSPLCSPSVVKHAFPGAFSFFQRWDDTDKGVRRKRGCTTLLLAAWSQCHLLHSITSAVRLTWSHWRGHWTVISTHPSATFIACLTAEIQIWPPLQRTEKTFTWGLLPLCAFNSCLYVCNLPMNHSPKGLDTEEKQLFTRLDVPVLGLRVKPLTLFRETTKMELRPTSLSIISSGGHMQISNKFDTRTIGLILQKSSKGYSLLILQQLLSQLLSLSVATAETVSTEAKALDLPYQR